LPPVDGAIVSTLRVEPGKPARLSARGPADKLGLSDKDNARQLVEGMVRDLGDYHERLWAENKRSVLLVLQGMDTSGKDGTIRRVLSGLNPQGCEVTSFKAPTDIELAHDYLWRVHSVCPPRGKLGVFNRSHYEDVLAARFMSVATHAECRRRYVHITAFEQLLHDEGTTVVKVFLHLSKEEQKRRLEARLADPRKAWKFHPSDLDVRKQWDDYMEGYDEVLTQTSTADAPWHVVPADRKWVRDVAVSALLLETFRALDPQIPPPDPSLAGITVE
jgi:PPK2 family polyphosphate:nucleotide phosphotransferase